MQRLAQANIQRLTLFVIFACSLVWMMLRYAFLNQTNNNPHNTAKPDTSRIITIFKKHMYDINSSSSNFYLDYKNDPQLSDEIEPFVFHKPTRDNMFGKAYVITIQRRLPETVITAARGCGFEPYLVEAIQPLNTQFTKRNEFADYCFAGSNVTTPSDMSLGQIALVGSHRRALKLVALDNSAHDDQWSLILEHDARLHPLALSGEVNAKNMILEAMRHEKRSNGYGFMYVGACYGPSQRCFGYSDPRKSSKFPGNVSSTNSYGMNCTGWCTHGLAITKKRAKTLYEEVYCVNSTTNLRVDCGCHRKMCHSDSSLFYFFDKKRRLPLPIPVQTERPFVLPTTLLVGPQLQSPHIPDHFGLLYQCCRDDELIKSGNGTSLKAIENFISPRSLECYNMIYSPRNKHQSNIDLGELMFQYAALIGICVKRGYPYDHCAGITYGIDGISYHDALRQGHMSRNIPYGSDIPSIQLLRTSFDIPETICPVISGSVYTENITSNSLYDNSVEHQQPGKIFQGNFASYKYFHPIAYREVNAVFQATSNVKLLVDKIIRFVRNAGGSSNLNEHRLTCLSTPLRLESLEYHNKALSFIHNYRSIQSLTLLFIDFYHSDNDEILSQRNTIHAALLHEHIHDSMLNVTITRQWDAVESLYAMSQCDNIILPPYNATESSSHLTWWAAYLSMNYNRSLVIAPDSKHPDFYLPEWITIK